MISELEIQNFKGISKIKLTNFNRFNILIGKNDASKSTILEAIYAFKAVVVNAPIEFKAVIRSAFRQQLARELWHNYSTLADPTVKINLNGTICSLTFHSGFDFNTVDITLLVEGKNAAVLKLDSKFTAVKQNTITKLLQQLEGATKSGLINMRFFDEVFRLMIQTWETEIVNRKLTPVEIYDKSLTNFSPSDYADGQQRLSLGHGSSGVYIDGYGDGHKAGFSLLTIVKGEKNSTILIEEIETHQHPSSLRDLIDNLMQICIENDNQLFVSTHSPEVLQLFSKSSETQIFHLQKTGTDIIVNQIMSKDINMIRDIGWDIGNILKFEKFVITEGIIDQIVIRNTFHKLKNYWPEEMGINIIMAGGFRKQKELLKALSTDEKTIFIQRDYDSKKEEDVKKEIFNGFKELEKEGYKKSEDNDKIILKNYNVTKKLLKNNIFITGLPNHFRFIKKHAIDDYLLATIQKDSSILTKLNAVKSSVPTVTALNSKEILSTIFGNYNGNIVIDLIDKSDPANLPEELKSIITKIANS